MSKIAAIIGRIFLGLIFIVSGIAKLMNVSGTEQMITSAGLPGGFAIVAGICELVAGLCLAAGLMVRLVSFLLAIFLALTIVFFQNDFSDPAVGMAAIENLAIIGGLLLAFAHSHMWHHYDAIRGERSAERRVHEAELRAARAEGVAEARGTAAADADGHPASVTHRRRRWFEW